MANRDLLKEAIADAKAVKETAIANAKAALEEAFDSRMKDLLSRRISEMDKEEDLEEAEEKMEEGLEEMYDTTEEAMDMDNMEEAEKSDEVDLEELLRELDELEMEESITEETSEPHGNIGAQVPEGEPLGFLEEEEEEIDLENMSEDDLKKFIESVIADMVAAGELEGEIDGEEGDEEEGEEDEEEVEDYKKMEENYKMEKKPINEVDMVSAMAITSGIIAAVFSMGLVKASSDEKKDIEAEAERLVKTGKTAEDAATMAIASVKEKGSKAYGTGTKAAGNAGSAFAESEMEEMKGELEEAYSTIKTIKTELQEVNLFNAKLLYTNKIFKAKNLTESQKVKVLAAFDKAASVNEAKLVFETLSEGFKEKKSSVNESMLRGSASKVTGVVEKKPIMEVNDQFTRWQKLAGIK
jgi:hypothetical protein